jgi:hypothetical protein
MKYRIQRVADHAIFKVDFLTNQTRLQRAIDQAQAKAPFTHRNDPAARSRTEQEVFNAQLLGTLADIACCDLLQAYFNQQNARHFSVERYDDVRTDNFERTDLYDARLIYGDQLLAEMEIRSSICNRVSLERMIQIWHILGWYHTADKATEKIREFYIRPIYHYNKYGSNSTYTLAKANSHLLEGDLDLYIVGGATAQILEDKGEVQTGWGLLQRGATYQVVPITEGLDAREFLATVLNFCSNAIK